MGNAPCSLFLCFVSYYRLAMPPPHPLSTRMNIAQAPVGYRSRKPNGVPINSRLMSRMRLEDWEAAVAMHAKAVYDTKPREVKSRQINNAKQVNWEVAVTSCTKAEYKSKLYCPLLYYLSFS